MKYKVENIGQVDLTDKDFKAAGGEANIYIKNGIAYKIFHNNSFNLGKTRELSVLNHPNVVRPENVVFHNNNAVGYTMRVVDGNVWCQLFTTTFKQREKISNKRVLELIKELKDLVKFVHSNNILVVDLNPMNFLFDKHVYAIDVNSYQTKNYPATAIMDSVRDRHNQSFNNGTDWFSWGVITFNALTNIHPYDGNHPKYTGKSDVKRNKRMLDNVSVFNSEVRYPNAVDLSIIPNALKDWYIDTFDKGLREEPVFDVKQVIVNKKVASTGPIKLTKIYEFDDNVVSYQRLLNKDVILTEKQVIVDSKKYSREKIKYVVPTVDRLRLVFVSVDHNITVTDELGHSNVTPNTFDYLFTLGDLLYGVQHGKLLRLDILNYSLPVVAFKQVGNVLDVPQAVLIKDNVLIQNLLGTYHAIFYEKEIKQQKLDICGKILDAKYQHNVLQIVFHDGQNIKKWINGTVTDDSTCNFVVKDNGVCVSVNDNNIELFAENSGKIINQHILGDLFTDGSNVYMIEDNKIFKVAS